LSKHIGPPISESGVPLIAYAIAKEDATMFNALIVSGGDPNLLIPKTAEKEFLASAQIEIVALLYSGRRWL
jgi:hypothetical protein